MTKPLLTVIVVLLALALGLVAGVDIGREWVVVSYWRLIARRHAAGRTRNNRRNADILQK